MVWQTVQQQSHDFGSAWTYFYGQGNVVVLDSYADQYSLNWSTDLEPYQFARVWALVGGKDRGAIIQQARSTALLELAPGELVGVLSRGFDDILRQPVSLFRLFFSSVSVTWQLLSLGEIPCPAVVGVASDRLDPFSIGRYFQATARPALREAVDDLPDILERVHLQHGDLQPLRDVAEYAQRGWYL